ncbi:MAG: DUF1127 domain-containing protein [Paracoccaceae bacterium]
MSVFSAFNRVASAISRHFERKAATTQLRAMTDHELQDIGIHRSQIDAFVTGAVQRPEADPQLVRPGRSANRRSGPSPVVPAHAA